MFYFVYLPKNIVQHPPTICQQSTNRQRWISDFAIRTDGFSSLPQYPFQIIGADILAAFDLRVDVHHRQLIETTTNLSISGIHCPDTSPCPTFAPPHADSPYQLLFTKFPEFSHPFYYSENPVKRTVTHHIRTNGPPAFLSTHTSCF